MGLNMKNVNIMRVHQLLGEGSQKTIIYGELPKKSGLDNLQRAWQKIRGGCFWRRVDTSMHTVT